MRYEAEQNAGQAIYNRLHLQDERNRMTRIINAYKNSISILFIIHAHFVSMFCSFVFIYFQHCFNLQFAKIIQTIDCKLLQYLDCF